MLRHSHFTGLVPSNDNPIVVSAVGDLFAGVDLSSGPDVTIVGSHVDGIVVIHEIIERGLDPLTPMGKAAFAPRPEVVC